MKQMADAVRDWDFQVRKDSVGATAFRFWRAEYGKLHPEAFGENEAYGAPKTAGRTTRRREGPAGRGRRSEEDVRVAAWCRGARSCVCGEANWTCPWMATSGSLAASNVCARPAPQNKDKSGRFVFDGGQVIPTVVELTDPIQAWSIVPYGQSRRPESRHYADQAHLYSESRMRPAWHAWSQLRDHVVESAKVIEYMGRERD